MNEDKKVINVPTIEITKAKEDLKNQGFQVVSSWRKDDGTTELTAKRVTVPTVPGRTVQ